MLRTLAGAAVGSLLLASPALADLDLYVSKCAGAESSAHEMVNFCSKALETGRLPARAKAQVFSNLSIGYMDLRQMDSALWAANEAVKADGRLVPAYLQRAKVLEEMQRARDAAADYQTALKLDGRSAAAWSGRGVLLLRQGDARRAVKDLSTALSLEPRSAQIRFNRGLAFLAAGDAQSADADFTAVIRANPNDAGAYLHRARARAALRRADARQDFDQAIALSSEWPLAWYERGRYLDQIGDREAANADFLRAYDLGHSDPWLLNRVREISG